MTTCTVERIPPLEEDMFGDHWEGDGWDEVDVREEWVKLFGRWLDRNYPQFCVYGDEIHGPASYSSFYTPQGCQADTPRPETLPPLPCDGLWGGFEEAVASEGHDWMDALVWFVRGRASQQVGHDLPIDEYHGTLPPWMDHFPPRVVIPFGPHRGHPVADLPREYLEWLDEEADVFGGEVDISEELREAVARALSAADASPPADGQGS